MISIKATTQSPETIRINIPDTMATPPINSDMLPFIEQSILDQYKQITPDIKAIVFYCENSSMSPELLKLALQNLPSQIDCVGISDCNLGYQNLADLYFILAPYIKNKNKNIEIIAYPKLYEDIQALLNFEQLLEQVAAYMKQYPDQIPSTYNPINPNIAIESDMVLQFIQIISSPNFKKTFNSTITLALLYSGGIINSYATTELINADKIIRDQGKAEAYMNLWNYTLPKTTLAIHQQAISLIKELGIEHDISTQRQDLVKKYCSSQQNALESVIGNAIANPPFVPISSELILKTFKQLFSQLSHNKNILQILDQMHYWLKMFFTHPREEQSIKNFIQLFEDNKEILHFLDHEDLVAKCITAHNQCLKDNINLPSYNIPSKPSEEILLCVYIEGLCALANSIINQFIQNPVEILSICVNNIYVDILHGYSVWDTNINKNIAHIHLVYALFYAGIIINVNSHNAIDMHKVLEHLNIHATKNNHCAKTALYIIRYVVNKNNAPVVIPADSIRKFLDIYGHLDNIIADEILQIIDIKNRVITRDNNSLIYSNLRSSELGLEEQTRLSNNNNKKDRRIRKTNKCCNIM